jgi:hypothetical protein
MALPAAAKPSDFLWALVRTGYLPAELPPAITTRLFADYCRSDFAYLNAEKNSLLRLNTNYGAFSAPRSRNSRRVLALVHPLGQLALSIAITQHRREIKKLVNRSGTTLYSFVENLDGGRAFKGLDFKKWDRVRSKLQSEYPFVLTADISRFFYTIYTHSIPWAAIGKEQAKHWHFNDRARLNSHWSSDFDKALQCCQSRETFGIPVGPDTSRIIAEILMAGIESDADFLKWLKGRSAFRLVDDFAIGFEREELAEQALAVLRSALWKFNLQLNDEKTTIVSSKKSLKDKWQIENERFLISNNNAIKQAQSISRLLEITLYHCEESRTDNPALLTCQRLSKVRDVARNLPLILDTLFRLAREYPRCISHVAVFLVNNRNICRKRQYKERITKWVRATLNAHARHEHDFEVAWCLVVCGALRIKVRKADISIPGQVPGSIVFALLGLLSERKLLTVPLSTWPWKAEFKKAGVFSHRWLPFYEAVRRKWTNDKAMIKAVNSNPVMARMLAKKVTFLEDRIFDAAEINITRRTFVRPLSGPAGRTKKKSLRRPTSKDQRSRRPQFVLTATQLGYD